MHTPLAQRLLSTEQSTGGPGMHWPFEQVPERVQASMSSHWAPSLPGIDEQESVASSQAPTWHASGGIQYFALPPTHTPFMHTSFSVQNCPSSQAPNSLAGALTQVPLTQAPT